MSLFRRITRLIAFQRAVGVLLAEYLRLVWTTNRRVIEPADFYQRVSPDLPIIAALWHGQHYMAPFVRRAEHRVKVLISRHRDGEINATAVKWLGSQVVRGSGDHGRRYDRKGGVGAFKGMLEALATGYSVVLTADVPKVSRVAGTGIVMLARFSGRPIYPVAVATSRRKVFDNWDRSVLNLPFGSLAIVVGDPIRVAADADESAQEAARQAVQAALDAVTARAYEIVDGPGTRR